MEKALIAQGVANKLMATENSIDKAIADASQFMGELMQARQELHLSAVTGDQTVAKVAQAISALAEARKSMVEAHHELADVKLRVGIRTKLIGVIPKTSAEFAAADHLREVG